MTYQGEENRQTGRSFRACVQAVFAASSKDDRTVFFVVPKRVQVGYTMRTLRTILGAIRGCSFTRVSAHLPNGSTIQVVGSDSESLYGLPLHVSDTMVIRDHKLP